MLTPLKTEIEKIISKLNNNWDAFTAREKRDILEVLISKRLVPKTFLRNNLSAKQQKWAMDAWNKLKN